MSIAENVLIGRFTLAAGISAVLQLAFLVLMAVVSRSPFGEISDYFYALTPLLILPFFLAFRKLLESQSGGFVPAVQVLGIIGIAVASLAQVILLLKAIDFNQSVWGNSIGMGLIGIPILMFAVLSLGASRLPAAFNWFGLILGIAMAVGLISIFFFSKEFQALGSGGALDWSAANPLLYPAVLAGMLTQVGLPVWLIWAAQLMLSGRLNFAG